MASLQISETPTSTVPQSPPLLHSGDRMDQPTFHALYETTPEDFRAELIEGMVIVASPVSADHSHPHAKVMAWLSQYWEETPGTDLLLDATFILDERNEPQPDAALFIEPHLGGQTRKQGKYMAGAPELAVEVSYSSWAVDLNDKLRAYEAAGVREYLVVVVHDETLRWFVSNNGRFEPIVVGEDGLLRSTVFPGLWINPSIFFHAKIGRVLAPLRLGLASPEHAAFVARLAEAGATD